MAVRAVQVAAGHKILGDPIAVLQSCALHSADGRASVMMPGGLISPGRCWACWLWNGRASAFFGEGDFLSAAAQRAPRSGQRKRGLPGYTREQSAIPCALAQRPMFLRGPLDGLNGPSRTPRIFSRRSRQAAAESCQCVRASRIQEVPRQGAGEEASFRSAELAKPCTRRIGFGEIHQGERDQ